MISIVTGRINAGKSSRLLRHYETRRQGDGFVSEKTMKKGRPSTYHMRRLSTAERRCLITHADDMGPSFETHEVIGPYHLSAPAMQWVEETFEALLEKDVEPLYFDEVGLLEVNRKGFYPLIRRAIESNRDLVLVVREDLLDAFEVTFGVRTYTLLRE